MERAQGFAMQGARVVWTLGYSSRTLVQESAPYATITVFLTGTTILATIYSDNQLPPTPMANPFTANADGYWFFYAIDGRYDVRIAAEEWTWTIGDLLLEDPFRWTADQNANGHWLNNLGGISFINGPCHDSIFLDPSCNLLFTGAGGNTLMSLSPQGDLSTAGGLNANGQVHIVAAESYPQDCNSGALNITSTNGVARLKINVTGSNPNTIYQPYTGISFFQDCNYIAEIGAWMHGDPATDGLSIDIGQFIDNIFISHTTGYVGINTGNPPCQLSVVGDVCVTGNGRFSGPLQASSLVLNNGTCSTTIAFDANCYVVVNGSLGVTGNLDVNGLTNLAGNLKVDGGFALNGPWLTDQNANGKSLYGLQKLEVAQIEFNNGTCQAELQFDANCYLVLYGSMGITNNLDVNGLTNLAGDLKVDGSFTLNGPWLENQNANGKSLYGLQKLEVAQIELNNGTCQAEIQFDAACNLVVYGNLAVNGTLSVGGSPLNPGISNFQAFGLGGRTFGTVYQNTTGKPVYVSAMGDGSAAGGLTVSLAAWVGPISPPGWNVAYSATEPQGMSFYTTLFFIVMPDLYYQVQANNATFDNWFEWW